MPVFPKKILTESGTDFTSQIHPADVIKRFWSWSVNRKETLLAHNENIDVISTVGVGTEFIFSLPIAKSAENT